MRYIALIVLFVLGSLHAQAGGNIMFEQANALYHSKNYDSAAKLYTQLVQNGYCSDDLYYNMGNAFYKAQKIGWAIWSYRKSMQIARRPNTLDNYLLAKKQIKQPLIEQDEIFFVRWWRSLYTLFTVNVWSIIALLGFILFLGVYFFETIKKKRYPKFLRITCLTIFLTAMLFMFVRYHNDVQHYEAVLIDTGLFVSSNDQEKEKIPEGSEVRIIDKNPNGKVDMLLVQLSDLRQGYLPKKVVKRL